MKILEPVTPESVPFVSGAQTTTGKLQTALTNLNGNVLPICIEKGEHLGSVRAAIYFAAKRANVAINTTVNEGTLYVWSPKGGHRG